MEAYIYQAALWCEDCGAAIRRDLLALGKGPADPDDEDTYDSNDFPKGPFPDGGGEADCPQHCDDCGCWLENDLTSEGMDYLKDAIAAFLYRGDGDPETIRAWIDGYDVSLSDLLERGERMAKGKGE